jgi:hypothetical protein
VEKRNLALDNWQRETCRSDVGIDEDERGVSSSGDNGVAEVDLR